MRFYANQLAQALKKDLLPFYMVFGEEPYQEQQCVDAIRVRARQLGFDEIIKFTNLPGFDWQTVVAQYQSMSLFSARTLIELDLAQTKPGTSGAAILKSFAESPNPDMVIVLKNLSAGQDVQRSSWFKTLDKLGAFVPCYPLTGTHLKRWLDEQCHKLKLNMTGLAKSALLESTEGNLLACHQELEKLSLLFGEANIDDHTLQQGLLNQAKFNIFDLGTALLHGNSPQICKVMEKLMSDNIEPMSIVWALQKDAQLLLELYKGQQNGVPWATLCKAHNVWKNQEASVQQALSRLNMSVVQQIQLNLARFDDAFKHQLVAAPYQALLHIALQFARPIPFDLPISLEENV
ncbi:DNA polymerase III subunit delta [Pseudoalteromonas xiamenensis]